MREEYISDAFNMLDDAIIKEVDVVRSRAGDNGGKSKNRKMVSRQRWGACLAGACFVLIVGIKMGTFLLKPISETLDLPLLTITENTGEGMGFEGYLAYDVSELINTNPWREDMEISTLPVYQNPVVYEDFCIVSGADFEKMKEFLLETTGRLGIETDSLVITDDAPSEEEQEAIKRKAEGELPAGYFNPRKLVAETDGVRIEVDVTMSVQIEFDPVIEIPDRYLFDEKSYENMLSTAGYLREEYKELIKMENPQIDIYGGDYNIYGQQSYGIAFFDKGSNDEENLINYNFNRISFVTHGEEDGLWLVRISRPDLTKKMGDYPIISVEKARELLVNGHYITSVPYELPGESYIAKAELIYRTGEMEEYFMPYYRFYVEIPEQEGMAGEGMKTYGAYYVPAVESTYISNMPAWDGSFNSCSYESNPI